MTMDHGTGDSYAITIASDGKITTDKGASVDPRDLPRASDRPRPSFGHPDRTEAWV